ncbi:hypothetical protein ADK53_27470 [Streptomyces sp. WM6373]|uniref:hypothetical protein n=1 Tax=Streptomyces TaxID=1883 RepID=UPI0006AEA44F|nr:MULTISPECIES: hypothetical protein [unclassified Streptomyces]KOU30858.1 hypothetical protein ADK53_27470 [Streptomyces sp. WM6373]KOU75863.1 hypothetical protein ADK61_14680 [Streptomyces sp. XY66]KOU88784.1 hypothetical protein ADK93_11740 [Streptomyces sp. XY58]KOV07127.1 hypothetical protein ADK89_12590 [Streptomyces sp. XY37]KOV45419.1 hypothetical protein ADK99_23975 [Streptomyces sp. MMG1064]
MPTPRVHIRILRAVVAAAAGTALLAGCSDGNASAAPELPASNCFGVFTPAELTPFMGTGDKVRVDSPGDLRLTASRTKAICNIDVDGKPRLTASGERRPAGQEVTWGSEVEKHQPDALPYADNSRLWDSGAAVVLGCTGPTESFDLTLFIDAVPDGLRQEERRPAFAALMKKFMESAKQQTGCGT